MPRKTAGSLNKSESIRIRMTPESKAIIEKLKSMGPNSSDALSDFVGYLVDIGRVRYEKAILPMELGDDLEQKHDSHQADPDFGNAKQAG